MDISEQILNLEARRLRPSAQLGAQLGVQHRVLDNRGTALVSAASNMAVMPGRCAPTVCP